MPYVDTGDKNQYIGHCRQCDGQWVVTANVRGKEATESDTRTGRICPYCNSAAVYYTTEDNR